MSVKEILIITAVVFVVGPMVVAAKICTFPEAAPVVQSDGSEKCVCDTSRNYCGPREDLCVKNICDDGRILIHNCSCVCPTNYTETIQGKCIEIQAPRCIDGNSQCGLPSTADTNNTTTAGPPVSRMHPPEVNVTHITSTSVTLAIYVLRPEDMIGNIAVRIYGSNNETLLGQHGKDIDLVRNITEMNLSDLSPNTTYTVVVKAFLQNAGDTDARKLQIRTISEISEGEGPTIVPYLPSDNNGIFYIIISCLAVLVVLLIFLYASRNYIKSRYERLKQVLCERGSNLLETGAETIDRGENIPLNGQRNGDAVPIEICDEEINHCDNTDANDLTEVDKEMPKGHIYPSLPRTHLERSDDGEEDTKLMKVDIESRSSDEGCITQPNTIEGSNMQVISNQNNSIGSLPEQNQQDVPRVTDDRNKSYSSLCERYQHGVNDRTQLPEPVSIHSIQPFGATQPLSSIR